MTRNSECCPKNQVTSQLATTRQRSGSSDDHERIGCIWTKGPMFGLFESEPYQDPELGQLSRSGKHWKGGIVLAPLAPFPLSLPGDRHTPEPKTIEIARELRERFSSLVPQIESGLFEHYLPYKAAVEAGIQTGSPCPQIASPSAVWAHVKPAHVLIEPIRGHWRIEVAFSAEWDIEHTVAAIFSDWHFIELNGSV